MHIDWQALGTVFGVSLVATVGLVGLFTLGIVSLSKTSETSGSAGSAASAGSAIVARSGAYVCFALCAAAVSYGIYLIVA
ncbi:hypothetical protein [Streptomyces beijiangensis]|uniref:Uncharacterized protein n=1 Tax=Streptomyces beijiangensis TaxID=163361 RepID=A0A939F985_9ACTN|nr:hypothetical protein [Streptomyces beijiangensis]MBO0514750.1 hypothetical protein [Streptomyces beijiangensis]